MGDTKPVTTTTARERAERREDFAKPSGREVVAAGAAAETKKE